MMKYYQLVLALFAAIFIIVACNDMIDDIDPDHQEVTLRFNLDDFKVAGAEGNRLDSLVSEYGHRISKSLSLEFKNLSSGRILLLDISIESSESILLILGDYEWRVVSIGDDISDVLVFSGSGSFTREDLLTGVLNLNVSTDYSLITVKNVHINEPPFIKVDTDRFAMILDSMYYYLYVRPYSNVSYFVEFKNIVFGDLISTKIIPMPRTHHNYIPTLNQSNATITLILTPFVREDVNIEISSTKDFPVGTSLILEATPNPGWSFSHWEVNGVEIDSPAVFTYIIPAFDSNVVAVFK